MPQHASTSPQLHATAVAIDGPSGLSGILLLGPSGAGKSDLALRLIDRGARLIADDRVDLITREDHIVLSAPAPIKGLLEVRGLGILRFAHVSARLALAIELVGPDAVDRLPEPDADLFAGHKVPLVRLAPFEASAPIKVELALRQVPVEVL
jgi:serine kinase of HPr protein (carbohydrate metabolism regulator)